MEIDKLKHQTNNSFYLIIFIYTLKVALPARLLKAPLLRPEGSALLPWRERDSRHQLMTIYWHSILVLYSFQYHSLIQQQGRNLMEIHGIFVQFVDLFPLFPSSLFFIAFWWLTSRYLAWSCALSTSVHMWEAYHYNKHPPTPCHMETTRPEGWSYSWFVTKIPTPLKLQLSFWIFVQKIWWTSFCHFFLLGFCSSSQKPTCVSFFDIILNHAMQWTQHAILEWPLMLAKWLASGL